MLLDVKLSIDVDIWAIFVNFSNNWTKFYLIFWSHCQYCHGTSIFTIFQTLAGSILPTLCDQSRAAFVRIIFNAFNGNSIWQKAPKYGARCKSCSLKICNKISSEMLVKQDSIFCAICLKLAPLHIALILLLNSWVIFILKVTYWKDPRGLYYKTLQFHKLRENGIFLQ
jgi:hypothetical protein